MPLFQSTAPFQDDDAALRRHLEDAHLPSLLAAVAHVTGDLSILEDELRPEDTFMAQVPGGLGEGPRERAIEVLVRQLAAFRDAGCPEPRTPDDETLTRILGFLVPDAKLDDYLPLLLEELAIGDGDRRAPEWNKREIAPEREFRVAIIGAGMSGLAAAHRLNQAGVPFVIFEKNDDVGGTWLENTYPGCRVDIQNHFYSYSFAQRIDWPLLYSTHDVLLDYFQQCAEDFGLRDSIQFGTEVTSMTWDDASATWKLRTKTGDTEETFVAQAVVSAVGQLNRPQIPEIPGQDRFQGPAFHSAEWDHAVDLEGKRVAVIGTGASAAQFVPAIAPRVAEMAVFQRTPNWMFPRPDYHEAPPAGQQWCFAHVPAFAQWYRFWVFWVGAEGAIPLVGADPDWSPRDRSLSAGNEMLREALTAYLLEQAGGDEDLAAKIVPDYPPAAKRILVDNGSWVNALRQPHVSLVTDEIREIDESGVVDANGTHHPADVIVYGTGFQAQRFLTPMKVTGRDGRDLHEAWAGNPRAYLGITVPGFPNFFCLYGPNTNIVVSGSIIYFSECEVNYLVESLRILMAEGLKTMDCRPAVLDAYVEKVDAGNALMAWGAATVDSWYKNDAGRVTQNWPFSLLEYWQQTRTVDVSDYEVG